VVAIRFPLPETPTRDKKDPHMSPHIYQLLVRERLVRLREGAVSQTVRAPAETIHEAGRPEQQKRIARLRERRGTHREVLR
jgi:hypothetical protein